jgi:hypothetical protein
MGSISNSVRDFRQTSKCPPYETNDLVPPDFVHNIQACSQQAGYSCPLKRNFLSTFSEPGPRHAPRPQF